MVSGVRSEVSCLSCLRLRMVGTLQRCKDRDVVVGGVHAFVIQHAWDEVVI